MIATLFAIMVSSSFGSEVPVAAPLVAGPPPAPLISYANTIPYNIPPYAGRTDYVARGTHAPLAAPLLAGPGPLYSSGPAISPYAAPGLLGPGALLGPGPLVGPGPLAAPGLLPYSAAGFPGILGGPNPLFGAAGLPLPYSLGGPGYLGPYGAPTAFGSPYLVK